MKTLKFEVVLHGEMTEQALEAAERRNDTAFEMIAEQLKRTLAANLDSIVNEIFCEEGLYAGLRGEILTMGRSVEVKVAEVLNIVPRPPVAVRQALEHVRSFLPDVDRVTFTPEGSWEYSQNGDAPESWHEGISADVLRAAWDAVKGPAVFFVVEG